MLESPATDPGRTEMPEALRAELMPDAENLAVALTEAALADGLGFKGPFEEFGRIAEPLLLDALGAARRDGAQIANEAASAEIAQLRARLLEAEKGAEAMRPPLGMSEALEGAPVPPGRFAGWSDADCAAQCQMQARENLDPELSAFWLEVSKRILAAKAAPLPETQEKTGGRT